MLQGIFARAARAALLCAGLILCCAAPVLGEATAAEATVSEETASEATAAEVTPAYSRVVELPGLGEWMYYAQNDPLWANAVYEPRYSPTQRKMKSGACGPTSAAMAIAHQLSGEELTALLQSARDPRIGFPFCPCSATQYYHYGNEHELTYPRTAEDFETYLPVIFASFATGNNSHNQIMRPVGFGTNTSIFEMLADAYGLTFRTTHDWETARAALQDGYSVVTTVTRGIFTQSSHYLYIAAADDDYVYILDSLMREEYPADHNHRLEVLEPGVVRATYDNLPYLYLYGYYMFKKE